MQGNGERVVTELMQEKERKEVREGGRSRFWKEGLRERKKKVL